MRIQKYEKNEIETNFFDCKVLGEVFKKIESELETFGYVVCQYQVNGLSFSEGDEAKFAELKTEEIFQIEFKFETPTILLTSVLKNWLEEIPRMVEQSDALVLEMKTNGLKGNYSKLVQLVDNCQTLVDSLISLRSIIQVKNFGIEERWQLQENAFAITISETLAAFEKKDFTLMADVIEYDVAEGLNKWASLLSDLLNAIESQNRSGTKEENDDLRKRLFKRVNSTESSVDR